MAKAGKLTRDEYIELCEEHSWRLMRKWLAILKDGINSGKYCAKMGSGIEGFEKFEQNFKEYFKYQLSIKHTETIGAWYDWLLKNKK